MGAEQSIVKVTENVDSRVHPGLKVVQSEPLDDHVTYNQLFDALIDTMKNGHKKLEIFKHVEVVEKGANNAGESSFSLVLVTDGAKVDSPIDVPSRQEYVYSQSAGIIYNEDRHPIVHTLISSGLTRVLQNPLQVEVWRQFVNETDRRAGEAVMKTAKLLFDKAVGRDVTFQMSQPSPTQPGKPSVVSESLENDTTMDELWDRVMELCKDQSFNELSKGTPEVEEVQNSEDEQAFSLRCPLDVDKLKAANLPVPADATELISRVSLKTSKKFHALTMQVNTQEFFLVLVDTIILLPDPLRVEMYRFLPTPPLAGEPLRDTVSAFLSSSIKKVQEKEG